MLNAVTEHLELEDCTQRIVHSFKRAQHLKNNIVQIPFKHVLCVRAHLMSGLKTNSNLLLHKQFVEKR